MNHYPHHIGDFNNATRHLTRVERSLYRDMIELYYDTELPLNVDPAKIARRVLATSEEDRDALKLVLEEFFVLQDDGWHNTRCDDEIAKYQGQIEQASRAGKASAAKRYGKNLTPVERPFNQPEPEPEPEPKILSLSSVAPMPQNDQAKPKREKPESHAIPACPHESLIDLFAARLPELPQPVKSLWADGKNGASTKSRWAWVLTACHEHGERKGQRLAQTTEEALAWFDRFFRYVAKSDFLTGREGEWMSDMGWLMTKSNFEKVISGNYEKKAVAA